MYSLEFTQNNLIRSFNYIAKQKELAKDLFYPQLNKGGVCLALAMAFAHTHIGPKDIGEFDLFQEFLDKLSTIEGIELFFKQYEELCQRFLVAKQNEWSEEIQKILQKIQPYWTQVAFIEMMLLVYASRDNSSPHDFSEPPKDFFLVGVDSSLNDKTLEIAGLKSVDSMSCLVSYDTLSDFLFCRSALFKSMISPFKKGGTYMVIMPHHACALHVTLEGKVLFYDPNARNYISSPADVKKYKNLFLKYTGGNASTPLPIDVFMLESLEPAQKNAVRAQKIQTRLHKAGNYFLHKNFSAENYQEMAEKGLFRSLFYNKSAFSRSLLEQTLRYCHEQNKVDFWDLCDKHYKSEPLLLIEMLYAVHQNRDFDLLNLALSFPNLNPWQNHGSSIVRMCVSLFDSELLKHVVDLLPQSINLPQMIIDFLDAQVKCREYDISTIIINALLDGKILFPKENPSQTVLDFLKNECSIELYLLGLKIHFDRLLLNHSKQTFILHGTGAVAWILNGLHKKVEAGWLLELDSYIPDKSDYDAVLMSSHTDLKMLLLNKHFSYWDWESNHPMNAIEYAIAAQDSQFLEALLNHPVLKKIRARTLHSLIKLFVKAEYQIVDLLLNESSGALIIQKGSSRDDKNYTQLFEVIRKINNEQQLSKKEEYVFGELLSLMLKQDVETVRKIAKRAEQYHWPLSHARMHDGQLLVECWLKNNDWEKINLFWPAIKSLDHFNKDLLCQATLQLCTYNTTSDWVWEKEWVARCNLSWSDFLPSNYNMLHQLHQQTLAGRGLGILDGLRSHADHEYVNQLAINFKNKLRELRSARNQQQLISIVTELENIKSLADWCGAGAYQSVGPLNFISFAMNEVHMMMTSYERDYSPIERSIEKIFNKPEIAQEMQQPLSQTIRKPLEYLSRLFSSSSGQH